MRTYVTPEKRALIIEACEEMVQRFARIKELTPETRHVLETSLDPAQHARDLQGRLSVGPLRRNAVRCAHCGSVATSESIHHVAHCFCREAWVDGGSHYPHYNPDAVEEVLSENWPWLEEDEDA